MRRTDKEITNQTELKSILENNYICRMGFSDNNSPYIVPMNYGYHENKIYLHTAKEGKKIQIIKKNKRVCFEITDSIEIVRSENACNFGTKYRSVIGFGEINIITDPDQKKNALQIIMNRHTHNTNWQFSDKMIEKILILEIKIESVTGKKSGI